MITYFHKSDLDGHASGAIVKQKYPETKLIGVDYADQLDRESIKPNENIVIVDFCFPKEDMIWLNEHAILIWMDHHRTSIDMMADCEKNIEGLRAINLAGCELTWRYFHPESEIPWAVWALGRYDVWDHDVDSKILPFQYGMRNHEDTWPDSPIWSGYFEDDNNLIYDTVQAGKLILSYEEKQNAKYAAAMAYEDNFHDYRAIVMNKPFANSLAFKSVYDPDKHDIMILISTKGDYSFKYTLFCYKPEIDVSKIAQCYTNGGGHRGAAGFYSFQRVV